ncbi:hypothetical protein H696_05847 [Fonticula alba]|uniref:Programmed cell death protein 5 n=1 Tax=Fonticula alba TaxID=691883 RepID=A0A058Z1C1_FONAL|nr:hypothetical protein H696_05847 [Fonticula alba]KCV67738.1 hypothetical protein H696_05847 [Fonticula alba]|eukprot:XP_009497922.1 hypothetical protein H696_05847 [Fonticula alba]
MDDLSNLPAGLSAQPPGGDGGDAESKARLKAQEDARLEMIHQILTPDARERLNRIAVVRPDKARGVEDLLVKMAQSGRLGGRVSEQQLVGMLEQISEQTGSTRETKIKFSRRGDDDDDDWEADLFKD